MSREQYRNRPSNDVVIAFVVFVICIIYSIVKNADYIAAFVGLN